MNATGDLDTVTVRAALVAIRVMDEAHPWTNGRRRCAETVYWKYAVAAIPMASERKVAVAGRRACGSARR
jgi:hypothetical protein